jgi:hypothetical protein
LPENGRLNPFQASSSGSGDPATTGLSGPSENAAA